MNRLAARSRPPGQPIMHQDWGKLLFLHWPIAMDRIRPLLPDGIEIDTHDGAAWLGITPFTMWGMRPAMLPAVPVVSETHELNVRTYVHVDGVPGVWFLSLGASNSLAVVAARALFHLPYYSAEMRLDEIGQSIRFASRRTEDRAPGAKFTAEWTRGDALPLPAPDSLEFFLVERYCLYSENDGRLYRARIFHKPWSLRSAALTSFSSTMHESHGFVTPEKRPLVHAQGDDLHVEVWPLEEVRL